MIEPGRVLDRGSAAAGQAFGVLFAGASRLRGGKPLHPRGAVVDGTLVRHGTSAGTAIPWVDEVGTDRVIVRLSRAVGLPRALPDVLGLALRFERADRRHDLLLATTGSRPVARNLLLPRLDPLAARYTTLFPYAAAGALVMLAAEPDRAAAAGAEPAFRLLVASPLGGWRPFARLTLGPLEEARDEAVDFDPVLNPLPGLRLPHALRLLREPAYAAARATRHSHEHLGPA